MNNDDIITRNDSGELAIRTVSATGDNTPADNSSVITRTDDGKLAMRITGGGPSITVDDAINAESENPVANSAIATALEHKFGAWDNNLQMEGNIVISSLNCALIGAADKIRQNNLSQGWQLSTHNGHSTGSCSITLIKYDGYQDAQFVFGRRNETFGRIGAFYCSNKTYALGTAAYPWQTVFVSSINNGSDISIPNSAGTMGVINTATLTLAAADWSTNTQTVTASNVTATNTVFASPAPASQSDYTTAGIICTAQAAGTLTFTCTTTPSADITVNVVTFAA